MKLRTLTLPVALLLWSPTLGQDRSHEYEKCINGTSTNQEWDACGGREIARQETRLNIAWKKAMKCFDEADPTQKDARQALIEEERLWIEWKEKACGFYYPSKDADAPQGFAGREGQVLSALACKIKIISDRSQFLESFVRDCR
jgi:uncharacterized protein YecT (DUF1311 family)